MSSGFARGLVLAGSGAFLLWAFFTGAISDSLTLVAAAIRQTPGAAATAGAAPAASSGRDLRGGAREGVQ